VSSPRPRCRCGGAVARTGAPRAGGRHVASRCDAAAQIEQLTRALALARRAGEPDIARQLALREADLRDLRERYAAIIAERDRQSALLAELATQLTRAHRSVRQLVPAPAAAVPAMEAR